MIPQQSWTIGSDPSCDIVVNNVIVSEFHCRLRTAGAEFTLEDLGSSNGTYVNGQRVCKPQTVSPADRVTLGTSQPMPWPENVNLGPSSEAHSTDGSTHQRVITLGRGANNTVVLTESNVSTNHARITLSGNEIVLEDLGSTNGTSVGKVENKIHRAVIGVGDTVFLGSTPYQVADWINRAKSRSKSSGDQHATTQHVPGWFANHWFALSIAGVVALGVVLLAWTVLRDRDVETKELTSASPPEVVVPVTERVQELSRPSRPAENPGRIAEGLERESPRPNAALAMESTVETISAAKVLARSLYVIVCSDPEKQTPFRVGMGFAIDSLIDWFPAMANEKPTDQRRSHRYSLDGSSARLRRSRMAQVHL